MTFFPAPVSPNAKLLSSLPSLCFVHAVPCARETSRLRLPLANRDLAFQGPLRCLLHEASLTTWGLGEAPPQSSHCLPVWQSDIVMAPDLNSSLYTYPWPWNSVAPSHSDSGLAALQMEASITILQSQMGAALHTCCCLLRNHIALRVAQAGLLEGGREACTVEPSCFRCPTKAVPVRQTASRLPDKQVSPAEPTEPACLPAAGPRHVRKCFTAQLW